MPATPADTAAAWERLGQMLQKRRAEIHPRYARRSVFCRERDLNYRLVYDIETGARANFGNATLRMIELAYGLAEGSIENALASGRLRPVLLAAPDPHPSSASPRPRDPEEELAEVLEGLDLTQEQKYGLMALLRGMILQPAKASGGV